MSRHTLGARMHAPSAPEPTRGRGARRTTGAGADVESAVCRQLPAEGTSARYFGYPHFLFCQGPRGCPMARVARGRPPARVPFSQMIFF
eukprot:scaffold5586_cov124-Isochrysis_galbana.AAC.16